MSNIKTRKGLAFGALVALGASLIAGAPANAAGSLNLVPTAGTGFSTISTETFNLRSYFGAGLVGNSNNIRYQVESTKAIFAQSTGSDTIVPATGKIDIAGGVASGFSTVALSAPSAATVTVTAYEDVDGSLDLSAGDVSAVQTVKFIALADVTGHINVNATHAGDQKVTGQVVFDGINASQLDTLPVVSLSLYNGREVSETSLGDATVTAGSLKFEDTSVGTLNDNDIVRARATFRGTAFGGIVDTRTVARTIDSNVANVVKGANALANGNVRANAEYQVQSYVSKVNDTATTSDDAVAGADVVAEFGTSVSLDADHTVTINGVTYKDNADLAAASVKLVSDAKGLVKVTVTTTGFVVGDQVYFDFTSQNILAQADSTVVAAAYQVIDVADNLNNNYRTVAKGGSVSVTYQAVDQFGQAPKDGTFIIKVKGVDGNAADVPAVSAAVVGGKATLTVANKSTSALGQHDVVAELWENVTTETIVVPTLVAEEIGGFDLWVVASAEAVAAKITVTGGTEVAAHDYALNASTFTAQDARLAGLFGYDAVDQKGTANSAVHYTATVTANDVATQPLPGAAVTISAAGLWIESGNNYGVGSLTVLADEFGVVDFTVYSHKSGKVDVTVTSGAATKTVTVNKFVADPAVAISSVTASASLTTGRVVLVSFNVVDQYGNAADTSEGYSVIATVTGAGYLVGANAVTGNKVPVAFVAGAGSVQLVDGADELGTSTVTATLSYVADGKDVSKTASSTYTFGQTDANLNISGKRVTADWVFAAGKTVTITRDGVTIRTFHPTANTADSFSFNLKKSKRAHRVTIKINGVTVTDAGYLVKK